MTPLKTIFNAHQSSILSSGDLFPLCSLLYPSLSQPAFPSLLPIQFLSLLCLPFFCPPHLSLLAFTAHKTLGHRKDPSGNQEKQYEVLLDKSNDAGKFVARSALEHKDTWTYYFVWHAADR
jgi:hypothetical protein